MRSRLLLPVLLLAAVSLAAQTAPAKKPPARPDPAAVHASALIVDGHADTPQFMLDSGFDLGADARAYGGHFDLDLARRGNVGAQFFAIWVEPEQNKGRYARRALELIDSVYQAAARHPDQVVMAFSADDIERARRGPRKRLAALMGIEGGHAIEGSLPLLRDFYRLGVRYMTLTWSNSNDIGDSSSDLNNPDVPHHNGLSEFGKNVVREMNRLGMLVDVSHVSDKTFFRTLTISRAPVIASHSSARALTNHTRNMTDEMLRAVARNGGVVMVNYFSAFIDEDYRRAFTAQSKERNAAVAAAEKAWAEQNPGKQVPWTIADRVGKEWSARIPRPPLTSLIDHIDHIAKVAGVDHVGLGSDFDGVSSLPQGIDSTADLPTITAALLERGYSAQDVKKILGGNFLRVFREAERVAREIQAEERRGESRDPALDESSAETKKKKKP